MAKKRKKIVITGRPVTPEELVKEFKITKREQKQVDRILNNVLKKRKKKRINRKV